MSVPAAINTTTSRATPLLAAGVILSQVPTDYDDEATDRFVRFATAEAGTLDSGASAVRLSTNVIIAMPEEDPADIAAMLNWISLYEP